MSRLPWHQQLMSLVSDFHADVECGQMAYSAEYAMLLQTCGKIPKALIEHCRIIPKGCVSRVGDYLNLSVV